MQKTQILADFWLSCKRGIDLFCDKRSRSIETFQHSGTECLFDKMTYIYTYI